MIALFFLSILMSTNLFADTWEISSGQAQLEVKHLMKTVQTESREVKGKMNCSETECEYLIAIPVKSFASSDSNRDLNMYKTVEAAKYPLTTAKGKFPLLNLQKKEKWELTSEIEFHGIKKEYIFQVVQLNETKFKASFVLNLDLHNVDRPSLFGIKIKDEVPMQFNIVWKKSGP